MANQETSADWICDSCVHGPPSSLDGKPCTVCDPDNPLLNCYQMREENHLSDLQQTCNHVATHRDELGAMSNEELAAFMERTDCPPHGNYICDYENKSCVQCWLDWLQSPAEGGGRDG